MTAPAAPRPRTKFRVNRVAVSVTRNESPGCQTDRSPTGREFRVAGLDVPAGTRMYRLFEPDRGLLHLSTDRRPGFSRTAVTFKSGRVGCWAKMTITGGRPSDSARGGPTECRASVRTSGARVDVQVDVAAFQGRREVRDR